MTRLHILLVTVVLGLSLGWIVGRRYFTYVLFVGVEPTLYPCPYADVPKNQVTCFFRPHEPAPETVAAWWHGWPAPEGQSPVPQPGGNCLRDILFFDRLPPLLPQAY